MLLQPAQTSCTNSPLPLSLSMARLNNGSAPRIKAGGPEVGLVVWLLSLFS